ncbi:class IV lanthionine synthetase LanL [Acrocarpospora macrocephala]|uniref:class IV lanthionine synthetase LanL n=1 Tax=Acrocarpospora macrocephala TaxID=150177 RepID=UPI0012D35B76|nr:class IV lanthionine synthetase LanL [Acrocarpospora macrocephala]
MRADGGGADSRLLVDIARSVLARETTEAWQVEPGDFWCMLTPPAEIRLEQGWKLHVSATQLSAPIVLARAAEVLVRDGCMFKFARGLDQLADLISSNIDRGSGGKFITAYPADGEQFRRLAAELDRVTDGLPGPVILSDRRLRPGSLVHYRFGVFNAKPVLTNDGTYESMLVSPDGERRKDERQAWYSPPPWAESPLPEPEPTPGTPSAVMIGDRFVVREAIRHSYRGGVYRAVDQTTGAEVILKQARPHVMGLLTGTDARDTLRHEADMLDRLAPLGCTPAKVALLTYQDNMFLAQELVPGVTLRGWTSERVGMWQGAGAPLEEALDLAAQLVEIMAGVHAQGLVLRDFNPNNLMVTPKGTLRLIDLELAVPVGSLVVKAYTPGFGAPEQEAAPRLGRSPSQRSDLYGLGATLIHLITAVDPLLPADQPADRPQQDRVAEFVSLLGADMPALRRLAPLVLGLMKDDPDERWSLDQARDFLAAPPGHPGEPAPPVAPDRLITDGLDHILGTMALDSHRLWPAGDFGSKADPCNVQHGAGGVLQVLTQSARTLGGDRLRDGVAAVAGWVQQRLFDTPIVLPGLYFGRSGTAWALHEAARFLGDDEMAAQAAEMARRVPVEWPNHDICHGASGAGMLQAHLWLATGEPEWRDRFLTAADSVLHSARERADGHTVWPIPATFDSDLAGLVHYGFAHGVAGAGTFLLYASLVTGRADYRAAALRAAETLIAEADVEGGAAWWRTGEESGDARTRMRHWCSGSSGVGTFLIRLWAVTGEQRFLDLAEAAGEAVRQGAWHSGMSACHGLAGDGDYLLDLADFTGQERYRDWAAGLATAMYARNTLRDGLLVVPDESGTEITPGYNTGLGGAVAFLLRLRHGGPRWWMLDELLARTPVGAP